MSALIVIAHPIVTALFQRGAFGPEEATATAGALAAFAIGLPAFVLVKVLSPGFFAREDTKTPVWCAGAGMVVNIVLNLILMQFLGHVGIALATGLAAWVNGGALAVILHRRGHLEADHPLEEAPAAHHGGKRSDGGRALGSQPLASAGVATGGLGRRIAEHWWAYGPGHTGRAACSWRRLSRWEQHRWPI